jgi:hypothetical protein
MALILVCCLPISLASCAMQEKEVEQNLKQPINCATAEGDIRVLHHEKAHVAQQIAAGVSAIVPVGLVAGVATGTEGTKLQVATGEYNQMIDEKIAEIKQECGIQ